MLNQQYLHNLAALYQAKPVTPKPANREAELQQLAQDFALCAPEERPYIIQRQRYLLAQRSEAEVAAMERAKRLRPRSHRLS